jgi:hypothetical protein
MWYPCHFHVFLFLARCSLCEVRLEGKSERDKPLNEYHREDRAGELGLINIWAYHCNRCNYTWLPKDFDFDKREPFRKDGKWGVWGQDLFFRKPPKSCARCKSKYWRLPFMQRKSKTAYVDEETGWIDEPTSMARFATLIRQGKYVEAIRVRPDMAALVIQTTREFKKKLEREEKKAKRLATAANPVQEVS